MWGGRTRVVAIAVAAVIVAAGLAAYWAYRTWARPILVIFHAGSLTVPMEELAKAFEAKYGVEVRLEAYGSVAAVRQVVDLGRKCDLLALADYRPILKLMWPDLAGWCVIFATNEMVIAYTNRSSYSGEIGPDNWPEVLLRPGVRFGRSDPALDPCGYRTLLVWELAEIYYNRPGLYEDLLSKCPEATRPKSHDLAVLLETGQLDYAFLYKSVAVQCGLEFVDLPDQIDLGHEEFASFYARAIVEVEGLGEIRGEPIRYAFTISKVAGHPDLALKFVLFMLSDEGRSIIESCGQNTLKPCLAVGYDNLPEELKAYAVEWSPGEG